jgi:Tol biopolymer transport system component
VAFSTLADNLVDDDTNVASDVLVHDRQTGQTTRASVNWFSAQVAKGGSLPSISAHGRYVAFRSDATNLVDDDTNGKTDVFVRDRGQ